MYLNNWRSLAEKLELKSPGEEVPQPAGGDSTGPVIFLRPKQKIFGPIVLGAWLGPLTLPSPPRGRGEGEGGLARSAS